MPAMIPTPWIKAYDPAQEFLTGYGQGAQVSEANARIAQASQALQSREQEAAMSHELAQRELEQKGRLERQQLEISRAYHEATIGMQKQKLAETQRMNDQKIQQVMRQQAAKSNIDKFMQEQMAINPQADPKQLMMTALSMYGADMQATLPAGLTGALNKAIQQDQYRSAVPESMTDKQGRVWTRGAANLPWELEKEKKQTVEEARQSAYFKTREDMLKTIIINANKTLDESKDKKIREQTQQTIDRATAELDKLYSPETRVPTPSVGGGVIGSYTKEGRFIPSSTKTTTPAPAAPAASAAPATPPTARAAAVIPGWMSSLEKATAETDPASLMETLGKKTAGVGRGVFDSAARAVAGSSPMRGIMEADAALASVIDLVGNTSWRKKIESLRDDLADYAEDSPDEETEE